MKRRYGKPKNFIGTLKNAASAFGEGCVSLARSLKKQARALMLGMRRGNVRAYVTAGVIALVLIAVPVTLIIVGTGGEKAAAVIPLPEPMRMVATQTEIVPTPTPEPTPTPVPADIAVLPGKSDPVVATVQERLMTLGYMDASEPTELFGSSTMDALLLLARQHEGVRNDVINYQLYELLLSEEAQKYVMKREFEGDDIKELQERLYQMGYLSEAKYVTGFFGELTEEAVTKFQEKNGLSADGKAGLKTLDMLYSPDAKANMLAYGEQSEVVLKFQKKLKELAYLTTTPDGKYGSDTVAAVKLFQEKNGLVVDGFLGPATRDLINSGSAQPNALTIGDSGTTVKNVQKLLVKANCITSSATTGYYGSVTEAGVRLFQATNGLSVDGKVGKQTMGKLTSDNYKSAASPASGSTVSGSDSNTVEKIIAFARSKLGCTYVRAGKGPNTFDCSGFVYWCLRQVGVNQSYLTSNGWRSVGKYVKITDINAIKAGDVIVFHINGTGSTQGHVGLASSSTNMVHAISGQNEVIESSFKQSYWKSRFICAWRIF